MSTVNERIVARLKLEEDGSLSNKRVERYALLRAEEVFAPTAAWTVIMTSEKGNLPSGQYQALVHKSPAFKQRLETLMTEKAELESTVWGQLEWQARQIYRRACALDDLRAMQTATDTLLKIAARNEKPPKVEEDPAEKRGRGAPVIEAPVENHVANARRDRLLSK